MIVQRQLDGTYKQIGFIKSKDGESVDTIVDANGNVFFTQGFDKKISGEVALILDAIGKDVLDYKIYGSTYQSPEMYSPILCDKDGYQLVDAEGYTLCSNDTPQYVIKSVGELVTEGEYSEKYCIPVVTSGKNLWNLELTTGYHLDITGLPAVYERRCAALIPVTYSGISSLTLSYKSSKADTLFMYSVFNGDTFLRRVTQGYSGKSIDLSGGNKVYFAFYLPSSSPFVNVSASDISKIQLELSNTVTEYEPYHEPITTNIYLDEPLKTGDILKYPENIIEHADGATESISLPKLPTLNGTTIITTDTEIQPSNMEITYKGRKENV